MVAGSGRCILTRSSSAHGDILILALFLVRQSDWSSDGVAIAAKSGTLELNEMQNPCA